MEGSAHPHYREPMRPGYALLAILLALTTLVGVPVAGPGPAAAAECLSGAERRQAVQSGQAMRPGQLRRAVQGEMIDLKLCWRGGRLVYVATVLGAGGAVRRLTVDAFSGALVGR
jgi:hypothetical protein